MRFGLSTHLFHGERLERAASRGDRRAAASTSSRSSRRARTSTTTIARRVDRGARLARRPRASRPAACTRRSATASRDGVWGRAYSNASPHAARREEAIAETRLAIRRGAAPRLPHRSSLHLGLPRGQPIPPGDNDAGAPCAAASRRSPRRRGRAGVRLALEVIPNDLSTPDGAARSARRRSRARRRRRLPRLRPRAPAGRRAGSRRGARRPRHHDARPRQRRRERRPPRAVRRHDRLGRDADGDVEDRLRGPARLRGAPITATPRRRSTARLARATAFRPYWMTWRSRWRSRGRLTRLTELDVMHVYIEDIAKHEGQTVTHQGLAGQPPVERQDSLPAGPRRIGLHPGRHVEGRRRRRDLRAGRSSLAGKRRSSCTAPCAPTRARRAATRSTSTGLEVVERGARLPHHAEGTRRRLPDGSAPPVDPVGAPAGDPARAPRGDRRRARLLQQPRLHPRRHADLHAVGLRGHDDAVSRAVLRRRHGVPHAERPALQRSQRDGARPRLLLRADVPRREIEDAPPSHRVLDGRARGRLRDARRRHRAGRGPGRRGRRRACSTGARAS